MEAAAQAGRRVRLDRAAPVDPDRLPAVPSRKRFGAFLAGSPGLYWPHRSDSGSGMAFARAQLATRGFTRQGFFQTAGVGYGHRADIDPGGRVFRRRLAESYRETTLRGLFGTLFHRSSIRAHGRTRPHAST